MIPEYDDEPDALDVFARDALSMTLRMFLWIALALFLLLGVVACAVSLGLS